MKKLLTVLCVAAFGIGAVAQAQIVKNEGVIRTEPKAIKENVADIVGLPVMSDGSLGQLKANRIYDTLLWHPEYTQPDCRNGIYSTYYSEGGVMAEEVVPGVFSPYMSGTGEVGATYQTEENLYYLYARVNLQNAFVSGAIAIACRMGNTMGWERIKDKLGRFDQNHISDIDGVKVPDMPFKLYGYEEVVSQPAFKSYTEMLFDNADPSYIDIEMPLTTKGRAETETLYLKYQPREGEDGRPSITYYTVGGLFKNKNFQTSTEHNFGLSLGIELTRDRTYDSLWNFNFGAKANSECTFVEEWSVWQRFDFTDHETTWVGFWAQDESDIDVNQPWFVENDNDVSGFAPPASPQTTNGEHNSLFVYNHSLLRLSAGTHYKPTLYPIIQQSGAANENNDAYAQTVSVYPLPATDKVTVVALDPIRKVEVYNMAGTLVKKAEMNDNVLNMDVTSFAPGAYIAKITTEKGVVSKKLLVK